MLFREKAAIVLILIPLWNLSSQNVESWFPSYSTWRYLDSNAIEVATLFNAFSGYHLEYRGKVLSLSSSVDDWSDRHSIMLSNYFVYSKRIDNESNAFYLTDRFPVLRMREGVGKKVFLIPGKNYSLTVDYNYDLLTGKPNYERLSRSIYPENIDGILVPTLQKVSDRWRSAFFIDGGISSIKSSSYLIERTRAGIVHYNPEYALNRIYLQAYPDPLIPEYVNYSYPWVEGVEGQGIGEWVDINFDWDSAGLVLLNGYVDFERLHLYKENSRVRRVRVESDSPAFSKEYELVDEVRFHDLDFPQKTRSIRMTILDVWPGTKYQDTAISMFLAYPNRKTTWEEEQKIVTDRLRIMGVLNEMDRMIEKQEAAFPAR